MKQHAQDSIQQRLTGKFKKCKQTVSFIDKIQRALHEFAFRYVQLLELRRKQRTNLKVSARNWQKEIDN